MVDYYPLYRTKTGVGCAMGFAYWDLNWDRSSSPTTPAFRLSFPVPTGGT